MSFNNPLALWLLLLLPIFLMIAWQRRNPYQRFRERVSLLVRLLIVLLLVLALAGFSQVQSSDRLATLFLVDASDSVGPNGREESWAYMREALAEMGQEDRAGIVLFGANALVERPLSDSGTLQDPASIPLSSHTDIASAIRLGLTLFADDAARRMILFSDGRATRGDARQAAQLAKANGVEISVIPLPSKSGNDVRIESLDAPSRLYENETFDLSVTIHSSSAADVPLQIFGDSQLVAQQTLAVQAGENHFILPLVAGTSGFTTFQARINPASDIFPQNNALDAFVEVQGPLSVLLVATEVDEGTPLAEALRRMGISITQTTPEQMPSDLGQLSQFKTLILVNTSATYLTPRQITLLQSYVRDLGHGLVVVGGEESYGPGGYFQTKLEETLPVEMTIEDEERLPEMSLMMIIDKSGSMSSNGSDLTGAGGVAKVELAKEAIARSLDLLLPRDRVGVVAFSEQASWVVRPTPVVNLGEILSAVGSIRADGGTDILAGFELGANRILEEPTSVRHIILLTDGGANPSGIVELAQALAENEITTSVVAIGQGYVPFLEEVARVGGGRFHFTDRPETIPQIFAQEATLATRSYVVEEEFTPTVVGSSPILEGITELPNLRGYVATSPKVTGRVILQGGVEQDPLLSQWQYGLGRAVVWTSDAKGQWAVEWISWPDFARFWSQVVRWTVVESGSGAVETQVQFVEGQAVVQAEVTQPDGSYRNDLNVNLSLVDPDLQQQLISLPQVGPGLYQGHFLPAQAGTYLLRVTGEENEEIVAVQTQGFVMAYSPEYGTDKADPTLLADLAEIGNGTILELDQPQDAFANTLLAARSSGPLWPWLVGLACLLLPLDVGLRRISVGKEEIQRVWVRIRDTFGATARRADDASGSSVSKLLKVKEGQSGQRRLDPTEAEPTKAMVPVPSPSTPSRGGDTQTRPVQKEPTQAEPVQRSKSPEKSEAIVESTTVRRLMAAKKRRQRL